MYFPITQGSFSTIKDFAPDSETGIGFIEDEAKSFIEPIRKEGERFLNLGSGVSRLLQNF